MTDDIRKVFEEIYIVPSGVYFHVTPTGTDGYFSNNTWDRQVVGLMNARWDAFKRGYKCDKG